MKRTLLCFSSLLLAFSAQGQIYEYKDASGRTVYSDQPPPATVTKSRTVAKEAARETEAPAAAKAGDPPKSAADRELEFKKRQKERQEATAKADKEAADKAARKEDCERAKKSLQLLESGERVAVRDDKGERAFLDDNQRAAEADRARKAVADLCR